MTVEKGIPIPPIRHRGRRYAGIMDDLVEPGLSKFAACPDNDSILNWQKRLSAQAAAKFGAGNYATRTVTENGQLGVRVWRTG